MHMGDGEGRGGGGGRSYVVGKVVRGGRRGMGGGGHAWRMDVKKKNKKKPGLVVIWSMSRVTDLRSPPAGSGPTKVLDRNQISWDT